MNGTTLGEPGSDDLLSDDAAASIQDVIREREVEEERDSREFEVWYNKHQDEWETEPENVEPTTA